MSRSLTAKETNQMLQLIEEQIRTHTPEKAKERLVDAGILLDNGHFAPPYKALEELCTVKDKA